MYQGIFVLKRTHPVWNVAGNMCSLFRVCRDLQVLAQETLQL